MSTKPDFLNDSIVPWTYTQDTGITDVESGGVGAISTTRDRLVNILGWTEPSTNLFKSPPDSAGKFIDILLTRISATNLEVRVRDYRGATLFTRRLQFDATMSYDIYGTTRGWIITSLRATIESAWAQLLDPTPDRVSDVDNRCVGSAHRTSADASDNNCTSGNAFAFDNGTAAVALRVRSALDTAAGQRVRQTGAGTLMYNELAININQGGTRYWSGQPYHVIKCDSTLAFSTDKTVALGDGTTGTFRVLGLATVHTMRWAARKA